MKKINIVQTTLFRRAFGGWKSTITRLSVFFTLCISVIVALAYNSCYESSDKRLTEDRVASSALAIQTDNVLSVDETDGFVDVSTVERSESDEIVLDETPSNEEPETLANEVLADKQPDEQEEIASSNADVSEEAPVVATTSCENEKEVVDVELCATNASFELRTGSISEIQIGYRVPGTNPEGNDGRDEAAFASEDLYIFTFRVPKADGTFCKAKLLRSVNWLLEQPSRCVSVFDGHEFNKRSFNKCEDCIEFLVRTNSINVKWTMSIDSKVA